MFIAKVVVSCLIVGLKLSYFNKFVAKFCSPIFFLYFTRYEQSNVNHKCPTAAFAINELRANPPPHSTPLH